MNEELKEQKVEFKGFLVALKERVPEFKDKGLDTLEDVAKVVAEELFNFLELLVANKGKWYLKLLALGLSPLKKLVLKEIDKIDGQEG